MLIKEKGAKYLNRESRKSYRLVPGNVKRSLNRKKAKNFPPNPTKKSKIATPEEVAFEVMKLRTLIFIYSDLQIADQTATLSVGRKQSVHTKNCRL